MILTVTTDNEPDAPEAATETDGAEERPEPAAEDMDIAAEPATRPRSWPLLVAAALVLVGALGVSGFLGWQLWQVRQEERAAEEAQQAAVAFAQVLTSIDSANVDENFAQVLDGSTGEFKDMYSQSSTQLRQLLVDNEAAAQGVVLESAVQSADTEEVVVLLFIDQMVSNTQVPDPRVDRSRVKMTMHHVDGQWRAAVVELP